MQDSSTLNDSHHSAKITPGVLVEVLWDIELVNRGGRRDGLRTVRSHWWRAEVLKVEFIDGRCKAHLRYDSFDDFKEQVGQVWVFPRHVRLIDDSDTQLRWRFYQCSGNVVYTDTECDEGSQRNDEANSEVTELHSERVNSLQEEVGALSQKFEVLQRMVLAQSQLFHGLIGSASDGDRRCANTLTTLCHKLTLLMQKPVPQIKPRKEVENSTAVFEDNCAGFIATEADCDLQTFQVLARVVKSKLSTACFRPSFSKTQHPPANLDEAEIAFSSILQLAGIIGITSTSDLMQMAFRERVRSSGRGGRLQDVAIRVLGTILFDTDNETSPAVILPCSSVHEGSLVDEVEVLRRETRAFDVVSRAYKHRLVPEKCTGSTLVRDVFRSYISRISAMEEPSAIKDLSSELRSFTLRWCPIASLSTRMWSRSLTYSEHVTGTLEIEMPFVLFRGAEGVQELKELGIESAVNKQIEVQSD